MSKARLIADRDFAVGPIDRRIFGSFAEHLGRCIYGGLYEPGHPQADAQGFRRDVLALVRELGVSVVRYPGGNFVSSYRWEDGVGPRGQRPVRRDPAWTSVESNQFGTDEFIAWCRTAGVEPMLAVNLGSRGVEAAGDYAEYCNHPGGTRLSDLRRAIGHADPHGVRLWCLGNEMDGPWQYGHKTATEYGRLARECAKAIGTTDRHYGAGEAPPVEFIACGSSHRGMPTYGAWEREVLEECYDHIHHLSLHQYYNDRAGDPATFLARSQEMDAYISEVVAVCDAVKARRRSRRTITLSFDEWNVWYHSHGAERLVPPWSAAPPILEDVYTAADALVVGGLLISLLSHADRVRIACLAQLVNVIGPIMTRTGGPAWRQTIFHPFALAARHATGTALRTLVESPTYACGVGPAVPLLQALAIRRDDGGVTVLALNRDLAEPLDLELDLRSFPALRPTGWQVLHEADLQAVNDERHPDRVAPRGGGAVDGDGRVFRARLPPASWSVLTFAAG